MDGHEVTWATNTVKRAARADRKSGSWWLCDADEFYARARIEAPRMAVDGE